MQNLLKLFIFSMFLLHGLSPAPLASFNFFIALIATPFCFFYPIAPQYSFTRSNILVICLIIWGICAWTMYDIPVGEGRIQGFLEWAASLCVLWIGVRRWIIVSKISFSEISRFSFYSVSVLSALIMIEFILANTRGIYFSDFLPFSTDKFPPANLFTAGILRPRGFAVEAGFTSMVLEALIPLSFFYAINLSGMAKAFYTGACMVALALLFSTTTFLAAAISVSLLQVIRLNRKGLLALFALFLLSTYIIIANSDFFFNIAGYKITAFFDSLNYSHSSGTRQEALAAGFRLLMQNPFGIGWGSVLQEAKNPGSPIDQMISGTGLINLWLELGVATGVAGVAFFGGFLWSVLLALARTNRLEAQCCFLSLSMLTIHHFGVYEVWFPMFWFTLALSQVILAASRDAEMQAAAR